MRQISWLGAVAWGRDALPAVRSVLLALWVGSHLSIGYLAVPLLFAHLPDRVLAGEIAGRMFQWQAIGALVCLAGLLLVEYLQGRVGRPAWLRWGIGVQIGLTLLALLVTQPVMAGLKQSAWPADVMASVWREQFVFWHALASLSYLLQSLLGLALLVQAARENSAGAQP